MNSNLSEARLSTVVDVVLAIKRGCCYSYLFRNTKLSWSTIVHITKKLEQCGTINISKEGRRCDIMLTPKGEKLRKNIVIISELLNMKRGAMK